jgi:hypothetical protein
MQRSHQNGFFADMYGSSLNWLDNIVMNCEVNEREINGARRRNVGVLQTKDNSFVVATN